MNNKILKHKLKKGDFIVDLNGEDTKGLGCGMVMSVYENKTFFTVLFNTAKLPMMFDQCFFRYDRAGKKGAVRALTLNEFWKYQKHGFIKDDCLDAELLEKISFSLKD